MSRNFVKTILLIYILSNTTTFGFLFKRRKPLAIDGGWSSWQSWTSCYLNSVNYSNFFPKYNGLHVSSRQRSCDSPRPAQGGKPCIGSAFRYRQCGCNNPLGMNSGRIENHQLFSNARSLDIFNASKARLGKSGAWCSEDAISSLLNTFYRIDLINFTTVTAIATDGIPEGRVSRYQLYHSLDGKNWSLYSSKRLGSSELIGNILPNKVKVNQLDEPITTKYLKIIPLHSYNHMCMKFEVYGCLFTCGKELTTAAGEVIGRSAETHDQECLWKINIKNTTTISLDFVTFDIPCAEGFLEIRTGGKNYRQSSMFQKLCGYDLSIGLIKVPSNLLWLKFYSNSSSDEVGFRVRYISECTENFKLNQGNSLTIHSPNFPLNYFDNNDCTWNVTSDSNKIYISFKSFDVEASRKVGAEHCLNDFLLIQGFSKEGEPGSVLRYCNSHKPPTDDKPLYLDVGKVRIQFKSDDVIAGKGFHLQVTAYDPSEVRTKEMPPMVTTQYPKSVTDDNIEKIQPKTSEFTTKSPGIFTAKFFSSQMPVGHNASERSNGKNVTLNERHPVKKDKGEPDWTVITVAAFSCFVFILIVFVTVISIRKCTSRYSGESGKFLPAITKKGTKDQSYGANEGRMRTKKISLSQSHDEQFCEMKSPAGSIQVAHIENCSEIGEDEPLKADIVNHTLQQNVRTIDMYTDGGQDEPSQEVNVEMFPNEAVVEETIL